MKLQNLHEARTHRHSHYIDWIKENLEKHSKSDAWHRRHPTTFYVFYSREGGVVPKEDLPNLVKNLSAIFDKPTDILMWEYKEHEIFITREKDEYDIGISFPPSK